MKSSELSSIVAIVVDTSRHSILFNFGPAGGEHWIPKVCVDPSMDNTTVLGVIDTFKIHTWVLIRKGILTKNCEV